MHAHDANFRSYKGYTVKHFYPICVSSHSATSTQRMSPVSYPFSQRYFMHFRTYNFATHKSSTLSSASHPFHLTMYLADDSTVSPNEHSLFFSTSKCSIDEYTSMYLTTTCWWTFQWSQSGTITKTIMNISIQALIWTHVFVSLR